MLRQLATDRSLQVVLILIALAALGEAGHFLLDQLNADVAHHFFHVLFPLVAFGIFGALVARDVRRHGWPTFSWQLRPPEQRGN